ncbi:MAG: SdpI family protein [Anaerotignum sp.]|nr:SdpI family protein [Anaerotignum sp.]
MKIKKVLRVLLMIAPVLMVLAVYGKLPDVVPVHWGINGEVDRYGSKMELFIIAGMNIFLGIFMPLVAKVDPKKKNYDRFQETYEWMIIWTLLFMTVVTGVILAETLQPGTLNIGKVICSMVGIMFIVLGNMMPKIKSNFFTGVKTPWALSSDAVWNKTQRLGGKTLVLGGVLILISAFVGDAKWMTFIIIGVAVLVGLVPTVMSYIWYQKEMEK